MKPAFIRLAGCGAVAWLLASGAATFGWYPLQAIEELFVLSPLVAVPLGLRLLDDTKEPSPAPNWTAAVVLVGGLSSLAAFRFSPGPLSASLACAWAAVTVGVAVRAARRLARGNWSLSRVCYSVACLYLPVGGAWFVASRLGLMPMGFEEPIVLLTAVHFHNSGFAASILAGVAAQNLHIAGGRLPMRVIVAGILAAPALIAAGFVFSPTLKLLAALWLALSLGGLALVIFVGVRVSNPGSARVLLRVSAASVIAGMVLSSIYAAGDFVGQEWISIPVMVVTHGALNGIGFVLCGLIGWSLVRPAKLRRLEIGGSFGSCKEVQSCASRLRAERDLSAATWRDGWSN